VVSWFPASPVSLLLLFPWFSWFFGDHSSLLFVVICLGSSWFLPGSPTTTRLNCCLPGPTPDFGFNSDKWSVDLNISRSFQLLIVLLICPFGELFEYQHGWWQWKSRNISRDVNIKCTNTDECTYWKKLTEGVFHASRTTEPFLYCDRTVRCRQNSCMSLGMHRSNRGTFRPTRCRSRWDYSWEQVEDLLQHCTKRWSSAWAAKVQCLSRSEEYEATFPKEDEKLTNDNINTVSENHPFQEHLIVFLEENSCRK